MSEIDPRLLLPQKLCAQAFGISVKSFANWGVKPKKRAGKLVLYYLPEVIAWRLRRDNKETLNLSAERARLAREQAINTEFKNKALSGELLDASLVQQQLERVFAAIKAKLLRLPSALAPRMAAGKTEAGMQKIMSDYIRDTLTELANTKLDKEPADGTS